MRQRFLYAESATIKKSNNGSRTSIRTENQETRQTRSFFRGIRQGSKGKSSPLTAMSTNASDACT